MASFINPNLGLDYKILRASGPRLCLDYINIRIITFMKDDEMSGMDEIDCCYVVLEDSHDQLYHLELFVV